MRGSDVKASVACPGFVATNIWEAERNRPAALAHDGGPVDEAYAAFSEIIAQMATGAQDAGDTAARMLPGVEADELHIITHPEMGQFVRDRHTLIDAAIARM